MRGSPWAHPDVRCLHGRLAGQRIAFGDSLHLNASGSWANPGLPITRYEWNRDPGALPGNYEFSVSPYVSVDPSILATYGLTTPGTYTIELTVRSAIYHDDRTFATAIITPAVPVPVSLALLGVGLAGLGIRGRRRRRVRI